MEFWRQRLVKERDTVPSSMAPTTQASRFAENARMREQLRVASGTRANRPMSSPGRWIGSPREQSVRGRPALWHLPPPAPYTTCSTPREIAPPPRLLLSPRAPRDPNARFHERNHQVPVVLHSSHALSPRSVLTPRNWAAPKREVGMLCGARGGWQ
uniref:Uncharacterized protein n=1 Tax=Prymnesium polylepis TaxID=72548 RepID=A0A6T8B0M0_9EUKA|eukprot:2241478-Prymnesium_polylepis.1